MLGPVAGGTLFPQVKSILVFLQPHKIEKILQARKGQSETDTSATLLVSV